MQFDQNGFWTKDSGLDLPVIAQVAKVEAGAAIREKQKGISGVRRR